MNWTRSTRLVPLGVALLCLVSLLGVAGLTLSTPIRAQGGNFHVRGTTIYGPTGKAFVVKGVNVNGPNWVWPRATAQDADLIASCWKFNLVRVNSRLLASGWDTNNDLDKLIQAFTSRGVVVMVTAHDRTGGYYEGNDLTTLVSWYTDLATRYRHNPYVWFDVMNEPGWNYSFGTFPDRERWTMVHRAVVQAIRDTAKANNIIMVEGSSWGQDGPGWNNDPVSVEDSALLSGFPQDVLTIDGKKYDDIIQSIHVYDQWGFVGGSIDATRMADYFDRVLTTNTIPMVVGEYGVQNNTTNTTPAVQNMFAAAVPRNIGRVVWHWDGGDGNDLTKYTAQGGGWEINDCADPTNLSWLGKQVWDDTHSFDGTGAIAVPPPPPAGALSRTGWTVRAFAASEPVTNAIDGEPSTRWASGNAQMPGQWFQIDMGTAQTFSGLELNATGSAQDAPAGYDVYVSHDGTTWGGAVASGVGTTITTIAFPTQTARYIKLVQTGTNMSAWWSMHEVYAFNR